MTLLIAGLVIFFAAHFLPRLKTLRASAVQNLGAGGYKGAFTLVSLAGLALIIVGYRSSDFIHVYVPLESSRAIAHALMPFAFLLIVSANFPCNMKRFVRHPMLWAVLLWAITHLAANGDLASVLLFGAFGLYAAVDMALVNAQEPAPRPVERPRINDLLLVLISLVAYGATIWAHGAVFGVSVTGA